jgi:hypothetical protein
MENVMNTIRKVSALVSVLAAIAFATSASATTSTYTFGNVLSGTGPNTNFATLTIDDVTNEFNFTPAVDLSLFGAGAFIGSMAVDYSGTAVDAVRLAGGVSEVGISPGGGPTGVFDFRYVFGKGSDRLINGETLKWSSTNFDLSKLSGLALHVQGIDQEGFTESIWYSPTAAVPEPETYAMMLAGLGFMGFISRRRRNEQA